MPADEVLASRVRKALGKNRDVEEKRMFGGLAFMVNGKMCVTVGADRIMCRIDPATHDAAVARPGCSTMSMQGRVYRGFVRVDAEAVSTDSELREWIRLALDYNGRAKASSRKRPSR